MKTLLRIALRLTLALGWAALLAGGALLALDQSGLAERALRDVLDDRLSRLGTTLEFATARFDWLGPGVALEDVELGGPTGPLSAERVAVQLGWSPRTGLALRHVRIDRGRLRVGPRLDALARALAAGQPDREPSAGERGSALVLPALDVRGLVVELAREAGPPVALATVDAAFDPRAAGDEVPAVRGRATLPAASAVPEPAHLDFVGRVSAAGRVTLEARAAGLELERIDVPALPELEGLRVLEPRGRLDLDLSGEVDLAAPLAAAGAVRLRARGVSLRLPTSPIPLTDGLFDLDARLRGDPALAPWLPQAWTGGARLSARWNGYGLRGAVRIGAAARPDHLVEAWVRVPGLPVTPELVDLLGGAPFIANPYQALRPEGEFDVRLGARLRASWRAPEQIVPHLELCAELEESGRLTARWFGIPPRPGNPRIAFPMEARARSVRASYARTGRLSRPEYLGVRFEGEHPSGAVEVRYHAWSPPLDVSPFARKVDKAEEEIHIHSDAIAVDERLRVALEGLSDLPALDGLWERYSPADGRIAVDVRLSDRMHLTAPAGRVQLALEGCTAAWKELPVRLREIDGSIVYAGDGLGTEAVTVDLAGRGDSARAVALQLHLREEPGPPGAPRAAGGPAAETLAIDVESIDLQGPERARIAAALPGVGGALDAFGPRGRADVRFRRTRHRRGGAVATRLEVRPSGALVLVPQSFPVETRGARGRVVSEGVEAGAAGEGRNVTRVAPLLGDWPGGALAVLSAEFPSDADARVVVRGSGLRPADGALLDALRAGAAAAPEPVAVPEVDASGVGGALDFESHLDEGRPAEHLLSLRRNELALPGGARLTGAEGRVRLCEGELTSDGLAVSLDGTRLELGETRARLDGDALRLDTVVSTRRFPLDAAHLRPFLDAETLATLLDEFGLRGRVDVPGWRLSYVGAGGAAAGPRLSLSGDFALTDVYLELGVPLAIGSSLGRLVELVVEDGGVRGVATLEDLYGSLIGRELGPVDALVSLYGSRLSLEELEGTFARGAIGGLHRDPASGSVRDLPGPTLAVDLAPPHDFELGLELDGADVAVLLQGLFPDGVASRGRLSAGLQLRGALENLLSLAGGGYAEVRESRLWSIPVFRALFSELGMESTAVFDEMACRFDLAGGRLAMRDIEVRSPILKLVGEGSLDLDGSLHYDLNVHYSALDKVQVVRELVYLVQSSLLSVAIRGDMSRPIVLLRGALTQLFKPIPDDYRRLPLPGYSRLPARF